MVTMALAQWGSHQPLRVVIVRELFIMIELPLLFIAVAGYDASTAGNMLFYGTLTNSRVVNNGDSAPEFAVCALVGPWMIGTMVNYTTSLLETLPDLAR